MGAQVEEYINCLCKGKMNLDLSVHSRSSKSFTNVKKRNTNDKAEDLGQTFRNQN
jgi:hypothetical protein